MRYFIHLGYNGTNYRGWQRQKTPRNTVQEVIEKTLSQLFKKEITVYGCGRTDAGVHASQYIIQVNLDEAPQFDLKFRLNKNLPTDIAVFEVIEVQPNQHCRHDAIARTYDYFIHWNKNPIHFPFSSYYEDLSVDFKLMKKAVALILKTKDFKPLCKQPETYNNTLCQISNCEVFIDESLGRLRVSITANRFLRGMVRICVFFLLEVGTRKISLEDFEAILNQEKEIAEKVPVYPNGLFLTNVEYPFLTLSNAHNIITMLKSGLE